MRREGGVRVMRVAASTVARRLGFSPRLIRSAAGRICCGSSFSVYFGSALLLTSGLGCVDDAPLGPRPSTVRVSLAARVAGIPTQQAIAIEIRVTYPRSDAEPVALLAERIELEPETFTLEIPLSVEIGSCLADPQREGAALGEQGCRLRIELRVVSGDTILNIQVRSSQGPVMPGGSVNFDVTFPSLGRVLTVTGRGPGTGSGTVTGTVTAPAMGGEPPLTCTITDGMAAPTGCTQSYRFGTMLSLTASEGLNGWGGACTGTGSCELVMDQDREVTATFAAAFGALEIDVTAPDDVTPAVTVSGPGDFTRSLTGSELLSNLVPGEYQVSAGPVTSEGVTYTPDPALRPVTVLAGETTAVSVTYNPPTTGSLVVRITGLPDGVDADVTVTGPNGFSLSLIGSETLVGLGEGTYTVTAVAVTNDGLTHTPSPPSQVQAVRVNQTAEAEVAYSAPPGISGRVTDAETGAVLPGTSISVITESDTVVTVVTNGEGVYAATVPAGSHQVTASREGYASRDATVDLSPGESATVDFALDPLVGTITGLVLDEETGQPVFEATIRTEPATSQANTDSSGTYRLDIRSGSYLVIAFKPGYAAKSAVVDLSAFEFERVDFLLEPLPGSISGVVTDSISGAGLPGVLIDLFDSSGKLLITSTRTDDSGFYTITDLPEDTYLVRATLPISQGLFSKSVVVALPPGGTAIADFEFSFGTIEGSVTACVGVPGVFIDVSIDGDFTVASTTTDSSGTYTISGIPAGTYLVEATREESFLGSLEVTVPAGGVATANFRLVCIP